MIFNKYDFAVIGGDSRQVYMVSNLIKDGYSVIVYGLDIHLSNKSYEMASSLAEIMESASVLITPIPFSKDKIHLNSKNNKSDLTIENFVANLDISHKVYGGSFDNELISYFDNKGISYFDLMKKEEVVLYNSIATAEGALAEAIKSSKINLHDSTSLVLGFGRCGKTLASKLLGLSKNVSVATRKSVSKSLAYTMGFDTISFEELENKISEYDFVFNTVADLVLNKKVLSQTKQDVTIIDIASFPGGADYEYASKIGRNVNLCLGLPGKYAPKSSAICLIDCILSDLRK